jgi:hypothetical protein
MRWHPWLDPTQAFSGRSPIGASAAAETRCGAVGDIIAERGVDRRITSPNAPRAATQNFGSDGSWLLRLPRRTSPVKSSQSSGGGSPAAAL